MNKELFDEFRKFNLPAGEYAIFGSGPMGIRNLRKCTDIDFIATDKLFLELKSQPQWKEGITRLGMEKLDYKNGKGEVEVVKEWAPGSWNIEELIKNAEVIDGLPFVRLEEVLKWKKLWGREKDQKDIDIIEKYFKI